MRKQAGTAAGARADRHRLGVVSSLDGWIVAVSNLR